VGWGGTFSDRGSPRDSASRVNCLRGQDLGSWRGRFKVILEVSCSVPVAVYFDSMDKTWDG